MPVDAVVQISPTFGAEGAAVAAGILREAPAVVAALRTTEAGRERVIVFVLLDTAI